jgi:hypothetical protein
MPLVTRALRLRTVMRAWVSAMVKMARLVQMPA